MQYENSYFSIVIDFENNLPTRGSQPTFISQAET
jgi:hypothetical protein